MAKRADMTASGLSLAALGSGDFILGFRLAGILSCVEASGDFEEQLIKLMSNPKIGVVVVQDSDMTKLRSTVRARAEGSVRPVVIPIGIHEGGSLRDRIRQAIGIDLYAKE
ncbi:MAG TPA: V-type ATP synthase subunit F [Planctomycetota bacterium]|nr:V-type ATP synthase subunit F [Planctomycetota bacterium]